MSTLLVIDGHEPVRSLVRYMLEPVGYDVGEATSVNEGMALCAAHLYDVVMLDLIQPAKDGLEAIMAIRRLLPKAKIVAMTGHPYPTLDVLEVSRLFGAHATLMKPFAPDTLFKVLSSLWRKRVAA